MLLSTLLVTLTLILSACGGETPQEGETGGEALRIAAKIGADYVENFSPFDPVNGGVNGTRGIVYEALYYFNGATGAESPLLASSYEWNDDNTEITFTLTDAQWSDGEPFTSADVLFTFNLLKEYPAADSFNVWQYIDSIAAPDDKTFVVTLKESNVPSLFYIAGNVFIVAEHLWADAGDPTQFTNTKPVGTGPYELQSFEPQLVTYVKSDTYRNADQIKVETLEYAVYRDNNVVLDELLAGNVDWGGFFAPDLESTYVSQDPEHNHYYMAPVSFTMVYFNLTKAPFDDVVFRKAVSDALNRQQMAEDVLSSYVEPANPAGIVTGQSDALAPEYKDLTFEQNIQRANDALDDAGYDMGDDGIRTSPDGEKLSYEILVPAGWTDWEQFTQIISENVKEIGMEFKVTPIDQNTYFERRNNGDYDVMMGSAPNRGPAPFYIFNSLLNSSLTADIGESASNNWSRYKNADTDEWLTKLTTTSDPAEQQEAYAALQKVMVEQLPVVLLLNHPDWFVYSTQNFTGFPSQEDTYALGAPYNTSDVAQVLHKLSPVA